MTKQIFAKFNSKCSETGKRIKKGEPMIYDYEKRLCYSMDSNKAKTYQQEQVKEQETKSTADMVAAQENAYFDNFYRQNYMYN